MGTLGTFKIHATAGERQSIAYWQAVDSCTFNNWGESPRFEKRVDAILWTQWAMEFKEGRTFREFEDWRESPAPHSAKYRFEFPVYLPRRLSANAKAEIRALVDRAQARARDYAEGSPFWAASTAIRVDWRGNAYRAKVFHTSTQGTSTVDLLYSRYARS